MIQGIKYARLRERLFMGKFFIKKKQKGFNKQLMRKGNPV